LRFVLWCLAGHEDQRAKTEDQRGGRREPHRGELYESAALTACIVVKDRKNRTLATRGSQCQFPREFDGPEDGHNRCRRVARAGERSFDASAHQAGD
jgi:hypothetical protein